MTAAIAKPETAEEVRAFLTGKLSEVLKQIQTVKEERTALKEDEKVRKATRTQLEQWESLTPLLHRFAAKADYNEKRWLLRALGMHVYVWRKKPCPSVHGKV